MPDPVMPDPATPDPAAGAAREPGTEEQFEARMREWKARWDRMRAELETEMDELRLKAHLGSADAKDEWERVESRFKAFAREFDEKSDDIEDIVEEKLKAISAELKDGVERLRKLF